MPPATRRQAQVRDQSGEEESMVGVQNDSLHAEEAAIEIAADEDMEEEAQEVEEEYEEIEDELEAFPPPGLKEISSLASWTVSTAKPGNGVAALRSPDLSHFWQSDGPQPHLLSIHFFKLVSIVSIRIFLDFQNDESYTPTKIQFLAGMGLHDMHEFAEMSFTQPQGWKDVDFSNVGPIGPDDDSDEENIHEIDWSRRPVLRAFLVQVRILENHQNGKDTHLRAVQIFARDEMQQLKHVPDVRRAEAASLVERRKPVHRSQHVEANNIKLAPWMLDPDLR